MSDTATPLRGRRAANMQELKTYLGTLFSPDAIARAAAFKPLPSDVIIGTYPKCGTTWTQQIVHGIRTKGSMDFDDVSDVIPWFETAGIMNIDVNAAQVAEPRAFKTHVGWDHAPKDGRYIFVVRNPKDALLSFYHFLRGWLFEADAISVEQFAFEAYLLGGPFGRYWEHLRSWWAHRDNDNFTFVTFDQMKTDLPKIVSHLAKFLNVSLSDAELELVVKQSSFDFMRQHQSKFDDAPLRSAMEKMLGLPSGHQPPKVRSGRVGGHKSEMPEAVSKAMDELWKEQIEAQLGFRSYDELVANLAI